ncbi:hypothetical protein RHECNPAF_12600125 [Rhizobium etli CNPAF512]|nr:hypothetical protein RHECNPAF_12600125 [Rhizobium etli CNPAF512]
MPRAARTAMAMTGRRILVAVIEIFLKKIPYRRDVCPGRARSRKPTLPFAQPMSNRDVARDRAAIFRAVEALSEAFRFWLR